MQFAIKSFLCLLFIVSACTPARPPHAVVLQTDFGVRDGAVAAMKGVIQATDMRIPVFDLTHDIPPYNTWEAAYRLYQAAPYWPAGTVFISVVDPGVGTSRRSIVLKTKTGHYFVSPDNGSLTLVAEHMGIEAVRQIDEQLQRRPGSGDSYTFFGRDLYAFVGAKLAAGTLPFEKTGALLQQPIISTAYQKPVAASGIIKGNIPVLDIQYGNVWTNITDSLVRKNNISNGDTLLVNILYRDSLVTTQRLPLVNTFGDVPEGKPLAYFNSLMQLSLAINMGNFSATCHISSGPDWTVHVQKAP